MLFHKIEKPIREFSPSIFGGVLSMKPEKNKKFLDIL